ncbi:MAG: hypothetical protein ACRDST_19590 [Pseudonocardiaceae bacterium]
MTSTSEQPEFRPVDDFVPTDELVRRQGVRPISSVNELALEDPFESDDEYAEFLTDLYASRRSAVS